MDKKILKNLKKGEKIVEMTEVILHNETVVSVTVYICTGTNIFGKSKIRIFKFPFYFASKSFAEEFLKYWDYFELCHSSYWDGQTISCFALYVNKQLYNENNYIMVDSHKKKGLSYCKEGKEQLKEYGVWDGRVCRKCDGEYHTFDSKIFNYKRILDYENVGTETDKKYIFKMMME